MKKSEWITKELNPLHDMDNIDAILSLPNTSFGDYLKRTGKVSVFIGKGLVKAVGRGSLVGGIVGLICSTFSGYSVDEGFQHGASLGVVYDSYQYNLRFLYHFLQDGCNKSEG